MARTQYDQPQTEDVPPPEGYLPGPASTGPPSSLPPGTQWLRQQTMERQASQLGYPQNMIDAAKQQYPILRKYDKQIGYKYTPRGPHQHLETWGSADDAGYPFAPGQQYGVEIYDTNADPKMIAGDAIIHGVRNLDPTLKQYYAQFEQSVRNNPQQMQLMQRGYQWDQQRNGEKRPFEQWLTYSQLPQFLGGGLFWQGRAKDYTPQQQQLLGQIDRYIRGQ